MQMGCLENLSSIHLDLKLQMTSGINKTNQEEKKSIFPMTPKCSLSVCLHHY